MEYGKWLENNRKKTAARNRKERLGCCGRLFSP
jgi:hypothetical protein